MAALAPAIISAFQPPKRSKDKEIRLKDLHQVFFKHCVLIFLAMCSIFATCECTFLLISKNNSRHLSKYFMVMDHALQFQKIPGCETCLSIKERGKAQHNMTDFKNASNASLKMNSRN